MPIELKPVSSSNIAAVGFQPTGDGKGTLALQFKGGNTYHYPAVSTDLYGELLRSSSAGLFYAKRIKDEYHGVVQPHYREPKPVTE